MNTEGYGLQHTRQRVDYRVYFLQGPGGIRTGLDPVAEAAEALCGGGGASGRHSRKTSRQNSAISKQGANGIVQTLVFQIWI